MPFIIILVIQFKTNKKILSKYQQPDSKVNKKQCQPGNDVLDEIYDEVCRLMEDMERNDEQINILDLTKKMAELAAAKEREGYSLCYLKKRVEENFKEKTVITNVNGNLMLQYSVRQQQKSCRTFRIERPLTILN